MSEICCKGTGAPETRCEYDDAWFCKNPDCKNPVLTSTMLGAHPSGCPKVYEWNRRGVNRMSDYDARMESISEKGIDRIKASSAEIVVHGTKEKPYFEIKYFDLSDNDFHIGFSSYDLNIVFEYLGNFFEIVNNKSNFENQCKEFENDLISRKAVIALIDELGYINVHNHDEFKANCRVDRIRQAVIELPTAFDKEKVIEKLKSAIGDIHYTEDGSFNGKCIEDFEFIQAKTALEIVEKGGIE